MHRYTIQFVYRTYEIKEDEEAQDELMVFAENYTQAMTRALTVFEYTKGIWDILSVKLTQLE